MTDNKEESQWRKVTQWFLTGLAIILALVLIWSGIRYLSVNANSFPEWTGFPEYYPPADGVQRQQTLIDWLDLLLLPAIFAIAGFLFSRIQKKNEEEIAAKARETERELALERQRQQTLENYLDRMKELILDRALGPDAKPEVIKFARTITLNIIRELGEKRNRQVIQFLQESNILEVISLSKADLSRVYLGKVNLSGADLTEANLSMSDLRFANLEGADLSYISLGFAHLQGVNLKGAKLFKGYLTAAKLIGANVEDSDLRYANLSEAIMIFAFLNGADLSEANLIRADLREADLSGANLSGANLSEAKYNEETEWPSDFDPVAAKAEMVLGKVKILSQEVFYPKVNL